MKNFASGERRAMLAWTMPNRDAKRAKPICYRPTEVIIKFKVQCSKVKGER